MICGDYSLKVVVFVIVAKFCGYLIAKDATLNGQMRIERMAEYLHVELFRRCENRHNVCLSPIKLHIIIDV